MPLAKDRLPRSVGAEHDALAESRLNQTAQMPVVGGARYVLRLQTGDVHGYAGVGV